MTSWPAILLLPAQVLVPGRRTSNGCTNTLFDQDAGTADDTANGARATARVTQGTAVGLSDTFGHATRAIGGRAGCRVMALLSRSTRAWG